MLHKYFKPNIMKVVKLNFTPDIPKRNYLKSITWVVIFGIVIFGIVLIFKSF